MNVLVFTSAMIEKEFASFQNGAIIKPNPSNQNFYYKLIKCLEIGNNVAVVSHRPFKKGMFKRKHLCEEICKEGDTTYFYTRVEGTRFYKAFNEENEIIKVAKKAIESFHSNEFIIVTDTLRTNILKAAIRISHIYNVKIIGMLTDNPENLSFVKKPYAQKIKHLIKYLDGYLSLTQGLVDTMNPNKPHYVFEGLVDDPVIFSKDSIYDYYFFGGSLHERYGVKTLVDAFCQTNIKSKLIIAGTGPLSKYIEQMSYKDYRIMYLPQLPRERLLGYEKNAIANINPRPTNKKLDNESVPSKLIEYLSIGRPIISTKFPKLYKTFKDDVMWIDDNSQETLKNTLEMFDKSDKKVANQKALNARKKAFEFYGLNVQSESINYFLASVNSTTNN